MSRNTDSALVPRNHGFPNVNMDGQSSAHFGDVYYLAQSNSNQEQQAELKRNELLKALAFEAMNARHMQLAQISVESLEWIWHTTENNGPGFVEWLTSEETSFWITGKPASGKSTLMNFLAAGHDCKNILQRHSGHTWVLLGFHFDFRAGSRMANSLEGLLRSLLFQFVQKISIAAKVVQEDPVGRDLHIEHSDIGPNALYRLIKIAIEAVSSTHRILAFIDGLDEYSGNYLHLVRMTERLILSGIDKICLASRPEHLLHQFLAGKPHFKMQDYNYETIRACVMHAVEQTSTMVELPIDSKALINEIVHTSDGVILWTRIATETLLDSLLGGDTEEELRTKLREFPTELNEAYQRLLGAGSGTKRLETALILHLIRTAPHRLSSKDLHCMLVFLRDSDLFHSWPRQMVDDDTFLLRLRARTGSMVDIVDCHYSGYLHSFRHEVVLFHRTLHDFLIASNWENDVLSKAAIPIDTDKLWLRSLAQCVLKYDLPQDSLSRMWDWMQPLDPERWPDTTPLTERPVPAFQDETTLKMARVVSGTGSIESGMALLECAITMLPSCLAQDDLCTASEQSLYQQALGSPTMILHFVIDRIRNDIGSYHTCDCARWCFHHSFYSKERLFTLSSGQRAILFAMLHVDLHTACSWLSQENAVPDQNFGQEILKAVMCCDLLHDELREVWRDDASTLIHAVAPYANDEIFASGLAADISRVDCELLELLAPYLATSSGERKLTKPWVPGYELNCITSDGYNLYLPWTTVRIDEPFFLGVAVRKLETIVASGLDVNAPCCRFGPPLHTVVEVHLVIDCWDGQGSQAVNRLKALLGAGADPLVLFGGLTVQVLARNRLQELEADRYVPVTSQGLRKRRAIMNLQAIISFLEEFERPKGSNCSSDENISQEGATVAGDETDPNNLNLHNDHDNAKPESSPRTP